VIHYHGTPITPRSQLNRMAGRNFCVSYAAPQDVKTCLAIGQSVMLDNGAFSTFTRGATFDVAGYYAWLEDKLAHPHWAVVPDAIGGSLDDQYSMLLTWPRESFGYDQAAAVFHLHMPLTHLYFLCNAYPKVCLGSSGEYWQIGTEKWIGRMDEIFNELAKRYRKMPWIHGMRMLGQLDGGWPFASADSTNVAQNYHRDTHPKCANCKASIIDAQQPAATWQEREQRSLFV
jgi:hypothetical protein